MNCAPQIDEERNDFLRISIQKKGVEIIYLRNFKFAKLHCKIEFVVRVCCNLKSFIQLSTCFQKSCNTAHHFLESVLLQKKWKENVFLNKSLKSLASHYYWGFHKRNSVKNLLVSTVDIRNEIFWQTITYSSAPLELLVVLPLLFRSPLARQGSCTRSNSEEGCSSRHYVHKVKQYQN